MYFDVLVRKGKPLAFPWPKSTTPLEISDYQLCLSYHFKHDKAEAGKEVKVFQPTLSTA